jgi:hypothetical protein
MNNLRATFYDINLDCKEKESKKSENLVMIWNLVNQGKIQCP